MRGCAQSFIRLGKIKSRGNRDSVRDLERGFGRCPARLRHEEEGVGSTDTRARFVGHTKGRKGRWGAYGPGVGVGLGRLGHQGESRRLFLFLFLFFLFYFPKLSFEEDF